MKKYYIEEWKGKKFNHLTIKDYKKKRFVCVCDCGRETTVKPTFLIGGTVKTCGDMGCEYHKEALRLSATKHGGYGTPLYIRWHGMKDRCYNPKNKHYYNYGGRGIKICDEWKNDFSKFEEWAKSTGFDESLSIDRIDVNGDYCPENCRWADAKLQRYNQREREYPPRLYEVDGVEKSLEEWAREAHLTKSALVGRMSKGLTLKEAMEMTSYKDNRKVDILETRAKIKAGEAVNVMKLVDMLMFDNKLKQGDLADSLNVSKQRISNLLKQDSLRFDLANDLFTICGYKLVAVPIREEVPNGVRLK